MMKYTNRIDVRKFNVEVNKKYRLIDKETGATYGEFQVGAMGGLHPINEYDVNRLDMIKERLDKIDFVECEENK